MSSVCDDDDDVQTIAVTHVPPTLPRKSMSSTPSKRPKDYSLPNYGVTYEFSHAVNLDQVIDEELKKLNISTVLRREVAPLGQQVTAFEAEKLEIEKIFSDAFENLGRITKQYQEEEKEIDRELENQTSSHDTIVIEDDDVEVVPDDADEDKREELVIDDDEDVQIVDTTYEEPKRRPMPQIPITPKPMVGKPGNIIQVNGPLDSAQLAKLSDGQLIQMVNEDGKKIKTYRVRKVPFYQTQRRAILAPPVNGMEVYAMKKNKVWYKGVLEKVLKDDKGQFAYRVKYEGKGVRDVTGKEIAWFNEKEKLPLGTRVIAPYLEQGKVSYYAGITAEPPSTRNNYRYLVFFDDGYAQYNKCTDVKDLSEVKQVFSQSMNVWEDVSDSSHDFIKQYLEQYPERPMVRLQKNQIVKTEWNGKWYMPLVQEVDASLVKMFFNTDERTEWIYRGSTRLAPLYNELANAEQSKVLGKHRRHIKKVQKASRNAYVEYTRNLEDEADVILCDPPSTASPIGPDPPSQSETSTITIGQPVAKPEERRAVARKSTASSRNRAAAAAAPNHQRAIAPRPSVTPDVRRDAFLRQGSGDRDEESLGSRVNVPAEKLRLDTTPRVRFISHMCSRSCVSGFDGDPEQYRGHNPLTVPMYFGWQRQIAELRTNKRHHVFYRGPCGRRLRCMMEVDHYLVKTQSLLTIDMYCFDPFIHPFMEFRPVKTYCDIKDLSYGKENVPISCVNNCDRKYPDYVEYSNQRLPAKGVTLNLDPAFLCGCDCEDDCRDRSRCSCRTWTVKMTGATKEASIDDNAGYEYRRLDTAILTGIYECNSQCKCSARCHNRVVQNGLALRLQVFKTEKRGWGLRCLDDIPMGGFVCIYAGQLLTDQAANEDGNQYGDEYLAELDHIEMIAGLKEGYEEDVVDPAASDDDFHADSDRENVSSDGESVESGADSGLEMALESGSRRRSKRTRRKSDGRKSAQSGSTDDEYLPDLEKKKHESRSRGDRNESDDSDENTRRGHDTTISRLSKMPDPKLLQGRTTPEKSRGFINPRKYFGEESCYIMDAKSIGNIGRYLNHSCEPNIFVQNVFVDTHDLRFPWVAFFASENIRAGTELTWDYNYDVGSVKDKVLYCYCGSTRCRGRLL